MLVIGIVNLAAGTLHVLWSALETLLCCSYKDDDNPLRDGLQHMHDTLARSRS